MLSSISHANPVNISDESVSRIHVPLRTRSRRNNNGHTISALYDTGAAVSILTPKDFAVIKKHGIITEKLPPPRCNIVDASQNPMTIEGVYRVRLFFKDRPIEAPFLIAPAAAYSIIGLNIIKPLRLVLDPLTCTVDFQDYAAIAAIAALQVDNSTQPQDDIKAFADVRVLRSTTIKARSGRLIKVGLFDANGRRILKPLEGLADMDIMAIAFASDRDGAFSIHVPNADVQDWKIDAHTRIGAAYDINDWTPIDANHAIANVEHAKAKSPLRAHTPKEIDAVRAAITAQVNASVPYLYRQQYIEALMQREHFFSADGNDLGFTNALEHTVDLNDVSPSFAPQFRLPADHLKLIQENVAGWLQAGIIERSTSKYNSPIFCVPKKHGLGMRCVLDYRKVNSKTLSDKYSIRTIDECLEANA